MHDVSVIGLGRVGLPLALSFADAGLSVLGVDKDAERLAAIRAGRMPFKEPGTDELLAAGVAAGTLSLSERAADAAQADAIVLTLGTPALLAHRDRHGRHPRGARRPAAASCARATCSSCARPSPPARPSSSPATSRSTAASASARTSSSPTCPSGSPPTASWRRSGRCRASSAGSARPRRSAAAALFERLGAPIVQTTPVQAELAKIWTNILRYATFALPNLLMMDCERYGANVFDVIELINRDYPRGGMALPGLTAGTCLRKDFAFSEERSNAPGMLLAVSRVHESVPLFLVDGIKRRARRRLRERKVAVLGLAFKRDTDDERDSLAHKLIRLLERELADVVVHDPIVATPTTELRRGGRGRRRRRRGDQPQRLLAAAGARARSPSAPAPDCLVVDPWNAFGDRPGLRLRHRASPRCRSVKRVLVTGGAGTIGAAVVRRLLRDPDFECPRLRPARRARLDARGLRGPPRRPARRSSEARQAMAGCTPRDPPGRDRRRDRELPQAAATPSPRSTPRSTTASSARRSTLGVERFVYVSSSMVFERAQEYPTPESYIDDCPVPLSAYGYSKLTGEIYCRAAHDEHGLPYTICRPFNAYGPGEMPDDEPGIAHAVPDLIRKSLAGLRPLPIFGSGEQTRTLTHVDDIADGIVTAMAHPGRPQRGLQHLREPRS